MKTRKSRDASAARTALIDKLNSCSMGQCTSEHITQEVLKLRERFNLPGYEWSYLNGYGDAIRQSWYHNKLVFAVEHEGKLYKMEWNTLPEYVKERLRNEATLGKPLTGHYWLNRDGTIGRPYFTSNT